ncbi:MAG: HEAT repeat domain-containing protein [Elusimicrobia bacterium]|nr:HEAT repeat domain-containing protein [Elusimicrobiota bacterium]
MVNWKRIVCYIFVLAVLLVLTVFPTSAGDVENKVDGLLKTLEEGNPRQREIATSEIFCLNKKEGLGAKRQEVISALRRNLKDENHIVRQGAATTLHEVDPSSKEVIPVFIEALQEKTTYYDLYAAVILKDFGSEANDAVPALIGLLKDNWRGKKLNWAITLEKIGTPEALAAVKPFRRKMEIQETFSKPFRIVSESVVISSLGTLGFIGLYLWSRHRRKKGGKIICWPLLIPMVFWGFCIYVAFWNRTHIGLIIPVYEAEFYLSIVLFAMTLAGIIPWLVNVLRWRKKCTAPGALAS